MRNFIKRLRTGKRRRTQPGKTEFPHRNPILSGLVGIWSGVESNLLTAGVFAVFLSCIALALFNQPSKPITLELPIPGGIPVSDAAVAPNAVPSGSVQILGLVNGRLMASYAGVTSAIDLPASIQPTLATATAGAPYSLSGPIWSPDGSSTLFLSKRDGGTRLFVGTPNGVRVLTPLPLPNEFVLNERTWIAWAPDAKHVALTAQSADSLFAELLIAATDKQDIKTLTADKRMFYSPLWLDTQTLVFCSADANGNTQIVMTDLNGMNPQVVFKTQ